MKNLSVLIALLILFLVQPTANSGIITFQKEKFQQNKVYKNTYNDVRNIIISQNDYANQRNFEGLYNLYSDDFVNADGFDKEIYFELVRDTWKVYPNITYKTKINKIEFSDNYASVFVTETAYGTTKDGVDDFETVGELYSVSNCVYYLEKKGVKWFINAEKIIDETSTLKYGDARYLEMELKAPKQIGANKYYTTKLKINNNKNALIIASINKDNIVYPQSQSEPVFKRLYEDNTLERIFLSNKDNLNEYTTAIIGITQLEDIDNQKIKVYMRGLAFIMSRVNVIPENKFVDKEKVNDGENK